MPQATFGLRADPSDETIRLGPLTVRFLLTAADSTGTVAVFELLVPGGQRLAAPAHSHDHYEETVYGLAGVLTWTVDGTQVDVGPGPVDVVTEMWAASLLYPYWPCQPVLKTPTCTT